jgi:hypothetical protein
MPKAKSHQNIGAILAVAAIGSMFYVHSTAGYESPFKSLFAGLPPLAPTPDFIIPAGLALFLAFLIGSRTALWPDRLDRLIRRHRGPFHSGLLILVLSALAASISVGAISVGGADVSGVLLRVAVLSAIAGYVSHPLADSLDYLLPFR